MTPDDILNSHKTARPVVMGVLNVTPDSFSDGGRFLQPCDAVGCARRMLDEGADVIDIGAESTRPGSRRICPQEQIARLRGVLPAVASCNTTISIDTTSAEVAAFALDAGASIINDISAGRDDPEIFTLAARRGAPIVLMHMLGQPGNMQNNPRYEDVVTQVRDFLAERMDAATTAGIAREKVILDPGIGFGKRLEHNLALLAGVGRLAEMDRPVLIGPSRKRFIGELTGLGKPDDRLAGTIAACLCAWRRGATIFRVHDVAALVQAVKVAEAIENSSKN